MRRLVLFLVSAMLLTVVPLATSQQSSTGSASAKAAADTVTLTEQDNGKDIDLTTGQTLVVKLKSNQSTGYSWAVAGEPAPLKLQKSTYRKPSGSGNKVGTTGAQVLQFNATSAGMATLNLVYRRSWEYNAPPAQKFGVRVNVR